MHPQIELLFQPFNSGSVREKMNQILSDEVVAAEDVFFFSELNSGRLWREYIVSEWFEKHSTTREIDPGAVNIIKTTINHLSIAWIQKNFQNIFFWGIWRNPYDVLASLLRNDFYSKWFVGAEGDLAKTVRQNEAFFVNDFIDLSSLIEQRPARAMAYIIAVRSYFYFSYLKSGQLFNYEQFRQDANTELGKMGTAYNLKHYHWTDSTRSDLNVIGSSWSPGQNHRHGIPLEDREYVALAFKPLFHLMKDRHGISSQGLAEDRGQMND